MTCLADLYSNESAVAIEEDDTMRLQRVLAERDHFRRLLDERADRDSQLRAAILAAIHELESHSDKVDALRILREAYRRGA